MKKDGNEIARSFTAVFFESLEELWDEDAINSLLQKLFSNGEIVFKQGGGAQLKERDLFQNVRHFSFAASERLLSSFGQEFTEQFFSDVYKKVKDVYGKKEGFAVFFELVPDYFLIKERVGYLTKEELGRQLIETNQDLHALADRLELMVRERTQNVSYTNRNLEIVNRELAYTNERLKRMDLLKSEFISIAAHQLRTPMSAIKWTFQMLLDGDLGSLNDEQHSFIGSANQTSDRMIRLINDLLNVSRIEEGRFGYTFQDASVVGFMEKKIHDMQLQADKSGISLRLVKPAKQLPTLKIDPEKLTIAVNNLLENAIKYTLHDGQVSITVEEGEEGGILVAIKDTGVGIPRDQMPRLFTKFFRGRNVTKLQTEGTGLGLYIAKNIIERHGGRIWAESTEGKGTTMYFTLSSHRKPEHAML